MKYLGECFDIHTSSRDLVFPHHENENAIAVAINGKPLARFWVHCERVLINGKKLDEKSAGLTIGDLMGMGYSARVIRFWLLSSHYRKPISFSKERLEDARRALERLDRCVHNLRGVKQGQLVDRRSSRRPVFHGSPEPGFCQFMVKDRVAVRAERMPLAEPVAGQRLAFVYVHGCGSVLAHAVPGSVVKRRLPQHT